MKPSMIDWVRAIRSAPLPVDPAARRALAAIYIRQMGVNLTVSSFCFVLSLPLVVGKLPYRLDLLWALALGTVLLVSIRRYLRGAGGAVSLASANRLFAHATRNAAIMGAFWGCTALFLPFLASDERAAIATIGIGLSVGACATLTAHPPAVRAYLLATIIPYAAVYLSRATLTEFALALLASVLLLALLHAAQISHRSLIGALRARRAAELAQAELDAARRQWSQLSDSAEAFALYEGDGRLLLWNEAYAKVIGVSEDLITMAGDWRAISAHGAASPLGTVPYSGDISVEVQHSRAVDPAMRQRWYRSSMRRIEGGRIAVVHVDITELKQREQALVALKEELQRTAADAEAASQAKSRFLANMSHELRTPLNAIIGFADLMMQDHARGGIDSARHENYARIISDSGHHLLGIVEDMLDLARIEAGKLKLLDSPSDLTEIARSAARIAFGRSSESGAMLIEQLPATPVMARVDPRLMRQAIINLLGNAIKFSPPRGRVWLEMTQTGDGVRIAVRDEGAGIPPERVAEVLEPFAQLDSGEARRFGGVGLGLPLAKQFIEMHGGRLTLECGSGRGTCACLWLPATRMIAETSRQPDEKRMDLTPPLSQ